MPGWTPKKPKTQRDSKDYDWWFHVSRSEPKLWVSNPGPDGGYYCAPVIWVPFLIIFLTIFVWAIATGNMPDD